MIVSKQEGISFVICTYYLRSQRIVQYARRAAPVAVVSRAIEAPIKKAIVAPSPCPRRSPGPALSIDLFTEHPAIAIYFIDCRLP